MLTSTGDAWESAAPVKGVTLVPFQIANDFSVSTEVSIAAIYAASHSGDVIAVAIVPGGEKELHLPLTWVSDRSAYFCGDIEMGGGVNVPVAFNGNSEHDVDTWDPAFIGAAVPVPTAGNNGDVLGVNNGAYALIANTAPMIVTADIDDTTHVISNASATLADVLAAAAVRKDIVFLLRSVIEGGTIYYTLSDSIVFDMGESGIVAEIDGTALVSNAPTLMRVYASSGDDDGAWKYDETTLAVAQP